jgi:hypothetical protein
MYNVLSHQRLASAATVFFGPHGAVSRLARARHCSRQALYRQADAVLSSLDDDHLRQRLAQAQDQLADAQARLDQAHRRLQQAVVLDEDLLEQFAATAQALGVSLSTTRTLLTVLRPHDIPSVAQLGRLTQQAGRHATAVLATLDSLSRPKAKQVAADEIYTGKKPVLMVIEQDSLCWLSARRADCCDGLQWQQEFRTLTAAEQLTRDGGPGLEKGLQLTNREREQAGQPTIADQEDHFHIVHRGQRALSEVRNKAKRALGRAEQAQRVRDRLARQCRLLGARAAQACNAWRRAEAAFDRWSVHEHAWQRLRAALGLFTPEGHLNTRGHAEAEVTAALAELTGPEWSRVRTLMVGFKALTFLDRAQQQLAALPVAPELVRAAVRVEGLRRRPAVLQGEKGAVARGVLLAMTLVLSLSGKAGVEAMAQVGEVLRGMWRSSSLVEAVNGVLRMHQGRHKRLTQGLLDLKRLYWNLHVFAAGKRKGHSPYSLLGIALPQENWWKLLKKPPEQLRQELSALNPAA